MAHISFVPRTGADLFAYLEAVGIDIKSAKNWALETFVLIDGKPMTIEQIAALKDDVYIILTEKIFTSEVSNVVSENNTGISFGKHHIKRKPIHRDFITEIQAIQKDKKALNKVQVIRLFLVKFFDVSDQELDTLPYELVAYMFRHCNTFLQSITESSSELYLDDIFVNDSGGDVSASVADMV